MATYPARPPRSSRRLPRPADSSPGLARRLPLVAEPGRVVVVSSDPVLVATLVGISATAGVDPLVLPDLDAARSSWGGASLAVVGGDVAHELPAAALAHRPGVLLVTLGAPTRAHFGAAAAAGVEALHVLPEAELLIGVRLSSARRSIGSPTVVITGARGGSGASTFAAALALTAARRSVGEVLLVDGDPAGGGLDLVMGLEAQPGLRWPDLASARGRASPEDLRAALPMVDGVSVLSWHRGAPVDVPVEAIDTVLRAGREGYPLVVLDAPRGSAGPLEWLAAPFLATSPVTMLVLVVPAEVRAVAAARQQCLAMRDIDVRLVVRGPAPGGLTADLVADELDLPLLGWLPAEAAVAKAQERGEPPTRSGRGPLVALCRRALVELLPSADGQVVA